MHHYELVIKDASEYLKQLTGEKSVRAIALRIGVAPTTIGRQIDSELRPELVVRICREYGVPVLPELVAIGFITEAEAAHTSTENALAEATDEQLALAILHRVQAGEAGSALTEPLDPNVGGSDENDNIRRLDDYRATDDPNSEIVRESLEDRHAALHGDDPQPEQEAPDNA